MGSLFAPLLGGWEVQQRRRWSAQVSALQRRIATSSEAALNDTASGAQRNGESEQPTQVIGLMATTASHLPCNELI